MRTARLVVPRKSAAAPFTCCRTDHIYVVLCMTNVVSKVLNVNAKMCVSIQLEIYTSMCEHMRDKANERVYERETCA